MNSRILILIAVLGAPQIYADTVKLNPRPRTLSMGGAGVAAKGGVDSASMNPAGLADVESARWDVFSLSVEIPYDFDTISSAEDYRKATDSGTNDQKRKKLEEFLRDVQSTGQRTRVNFYPSYTRKYFHVGLLGEASLEARMLAGGVGGDLVAQAGNSQITAGLIAAGGYGFFNNSLQVGVTLKPLYRFSIFEEVDQRPLDIAKGDNVVNGSSVGIKNQLFGESLTDNKAFGFGADLGVKYWMQSTGLSTLDKITKMLKPAFGVTLQDVMRTRFFTNRSTPADIPQSLSAGFALHPSWRWIDGLFVFDIRNILQEEAFENKIHFGAEARLFRFLLLRAGMSQLYVTGGLGLDFKYFQLDAYLNSQELYEHAHNKAMRVIGLRVGAGF